MARTLKYRRQRRILAINPNERELWCYCRHSDISDVWLVYIDGQLKEEFSEENMVYEYLRKFFPSAIWCRSDTDMYYKET